MTDFSDAKAVVYVIRSVCHFCRLPISVQGYFHFITAVLRLIDDDTMVRNTTIVFQRNHVDEEMDS